MDLMRLRPSMIASGCLIGGLAVVAACTTDYQQGKGDPNYGGPNALAGQRPPGATSDNVEGGAASSSGVIPGEKPKCVAAGAAIVDGGTCAVSFAKDVLGAFGLANCSTANCHGGTTPRNLPRIEPSEGPGMWQEFQAFTMTTGKAYINPCSTNTATMGMGCNLIAEGQPGACGVHMPQGTQMPPDAVAKINTWLKCGAPNN